MIITPYLMHSNATYKEAMYASIVVSCTCTVNVELLVMIEISIEILCAMHALSASYKNFC